MEVSILGLHVDLKKIRNANFDCNVRIRPLVRDKLDSRACTVTEPMNYPVAIVETISSLTR